MNIYVIDHSGQVPAEAVVALLRRHDVREAHFTNFYAHTRPKELYKFPALFFLHASPPDRIVLETTLAETHGDQQWSLIHYYRGGAPHEPARHPKVCPDTLHVDEVRRIGADWLFKLHGGTLAGNPDFSGIREGLPAATVAAYLMQKAGLALGLVDGLAAAAALECPTGKYEEELKRYFHRHAGNT